jgi:riboflavin biosynthesis pyrimidine reductase
MLLPPSGSDEGDLSLSDADLDAAYAWPDWPAPTPWLRANMVATADGAGRSPDGLSAGISSDADRRVFGRLRGLADVVLAGAGTVRQEKYRPARPKPDFAQRRREAGQADVPSIAVVSRSLDLDLDAPLFAHGEPRCIVIAPGSADADARRRVAEVADLVVAGDAEVDLASAVAALRERGLWRIHAEGGPTLLADLVAADLLDELLLSVSPVLAGGAYTPGDAVSRILAGSVLADAPRPMSLAHVLEDGGSLFLRYRLR